MLKPPLKTLLSSHDFERVASQTLSPKAWAFASSAATDCITHSQLNPTFLSRLTLRPRILRNVRECTISTQILGLSTEAPFFVAPMSLQALVHPLGETELSRGAGSHGIIQCVSTMSSYPLADVAASAVPGQHHFLQLYVNSDRTKTLELLSSASQLGFKAVLLTVDAPIAGKREADERVLSNAPVSVFAEAMTHVTVGDDMGGGLGRLMGLSVDAGVTWDDLCWIKEASGGLPLVLKGIQTAADAKIAATMRVDGIFLSNHGGRSVDTSPPALQTLLEIRKGCPEILDQVEIYVDGGVRRGTDIFKALCLGATAVGIGRPYLYALNYGAEGVAHLTAILKDELKTTMRMCGVTSLKELHPGLVNTAGVDQEIPSYARPEYTATVATESPATIPRRSSTGRSSAGIEAADKTGRTPLHEAAAGGHEALVRLLIDQGAEISAADEDERTPLHFAAGEGQEAVARLLMDLGANISDADKQGRTPLHLAAMRGQQAVARLLIDRAHQSSAVTG